MTSPGAPRGDLDRTLAGLLLRERTAPAVAHLCGLALVFLLVSDTLSMSVYIPWAGAVSAIVLIRAVLWGVAARRKWSPRAVVLTARITIPALGLAWGVGTAVAAQHLPTATFAMVLVALAGLGSAAAATMAADRWAFPFYSVVLFSAVLAGVALVAHSRVEIVAIGLILVFVVFTIRQHRQAHNALVEHLRNADMLRARERQLAEAQAIARVSSWELEMATNTVTWSEEAYRMYGVPMGTPVGYETFVSALHPEDRERVERVVGQALAQRQAVEFEYRVVRPDGAVRTLLGRNIVIVNAAGEPVRLAGTSLDITDRKTIEDALRAALQEVKTLRGYLRVCANCKRVHGQDGDWEQLESYVRRHTEAEFSHGICPDCAKTWAASGV